MINTGGYSIKEEEIIHEEIISEAHLSITSSAGDDISRVRVRVRVRVRA
jgi:hypothetical protein